MAPLIANCCKFWAGYRADSQWCKMSVNSSKITSFQVHHIEDAWKQDLEDREFSEGAAKIEYR